MDTYIKVALETVSEDEVGEPPLSAADMIVTGAPPALFSVMGAQFEVIWIPFESPRSIWEKWTVVDPESTTVDFE